MNNKIKIALFAALCFSNIEIRSELISAQLYNEDSPIEIEETEVVTLEHGEHAGKQASIYDENVVQLPDGSYATRADTVELDNNTYALKTDSTIAPLRDGRLISTKDPNFAKTSQGIGFLKTDPDAVKLVDGSYTLQDDPNLAKWYNGLYSLKSNPDIVKLDNGQYAPKSHIITLYNGEKATIHDKTVELSGSYTGKVALESDPDVVNLYPGGYGIKTDKKIITTSNGEYAEKDHPDIKIINGKYTIIQESE